MSQMPELQHLREQLESGHNALSHICVTCSEIDAQNVVGLAVFVPNVERQPPHIAHNSSHGRRFSLP